MKKWIALVIVLVLVVGNLWYFWKIENTPTPPDKVGSSIMEYPKYRYVYWYGIKKSKLHKAWLYIDPIPRNSWVLDVDFVDEYDRRIAGDGEPCYLQGEGGKVYLVEDDNDLPETLTLRILLEKHPGENSKDIKWDDIGIAFLNSRQFYGAKWYKWKFGL